MLLGLAFVSIVFGFFSPYYLTHLKFFKEFLNTGQIGDTIGGLINPFIALAGVIVTFLAFYMQVRANSIQIDQFNKTQLQQTEALKEQLFLKLVDNLNNRIVNLSLSSKDEEGVLHTYDSFHAVDWLINNLSMKMTQECVSLGRHFLAKYPELVPIHLYSRIIDLNPGVTYYSEIENPNELREAILQIENYNDRWEYIKEYVGSTDNKDAKINRVLQSIGSLLFYKTPFEERQGAYENAYQSIFDKAGSFLDSYMRNLAYILEQVALNSNNSFFTDYMKSNLSTQEFVLILYYCTSSKSTEGFRELIRRFKLLEEVQLLRGKFVDVPLLEEMTNEIDFILTRKDFRFQ